MAPLPDVSETWQRAFAWIEEALGGEIVRAERQPRWRPAWYLDVQRSGEGAPVRLYFRGDRGEAGSGLYSLEREMQVLRVLESNGIPVPHVYGFCPEPRGIVMERSAGRANLATAETAAEREAVLDHYVEILGTLHALGADALQPLGFDPPADSTALGLADFDIWERGYRGSKQRPEPILEYLIAWVRAHVPKGRTRSCLICSDSGQFLFERGRVTALMDLELATLGDPMADLAGLRSRDLSEPLGDLSRAFRHYEAVTGEPVDLPTVDFHTVRFCTITPLAVASLVASPPPGIDYVQYLAWYSVWMRAPIEVIAAQQGVALDRVETPEPAATPFAAGHDALAAALAPATGEDAFAGYERGAAARIAEYLRRADRLGPALEADDLREAGALLGRRFDGFRERDEALEAHVSEQGVGLAEDWLRYFHRHLQRIEILLAPVLRELEGASIQPIEPSSEGPETPKVR